MASLCRMCGDETETSVSLLDTSLHHLRWAINHFNIELDGGLPTMVCLHCNKIIREWTLFLSRREKADSLFSTIIAKNKSGPIDQTQGMQHPQLLRLLTSRTSNTSVPSQPSTLSHSTATNLCVSRLSDQVSDALPQNRAVDSETVDNQILEQRNEHIKLEQVNLCVSSDQESNTDQYQSHSSTVDDDVATPFEAIYVPVIKSEPDSEDSEPCTDLSAPQSDNPLDDNSAEIAKKGVQQNAELNADKHPNLPEVQTSPETSNPSSKDTKNSHTEMYSILPYKCEICDKYFKSKVNIRQHRQEVHASVRAFSCNQCEKSFVTRAKLKRHSLVHSDVRPFKCDKCDWSFKLKPQMLRHVHTVHSDVRAFKCHLCSKSFKSKDDFRQHLSRHSEIRPFECAQCPKKFKSKPELASHLRKVHSDLRPFNCDKCSSTFKTKKELKLHQLLHSTASSFHCSQWPSCFE